MLPFLTASNYLSIEVDDYDAVDDFDDIGQVNVGTRISLNVIETTSEDDFSKEIEIMFRVSMHFFTTYRIIHIVCKWYRILLWLAGVLFETLFSNPADSTQ